MMPGDDFFDRTEFIQYFRDETEELLQSIDSDLLRLEGFVDGGAVDGELVNSLFRALHTIKGSAGMLDYKDVQHVAHKLENFCDLLRKDRMPLSEGCVNLLFEGRDVLTSVVHAAIDGDAMPDGTDAYVERLDLLLNLVGELVINRTRISDIANTLARNAGDPNHYRDVVVPLAKDLADSSALLARTTNEIQESIMKVRMIPIGQVFDRFPRMVRDLAKARNKEIQVEISGADTDLDKTIVDEVGEPLMHLVRNCIDHGIEAPDERESRGKPRTGTIRLNAYHEGNQVIIEVHDDGGGVALEKVRRRGIKQGLIAETDRLTDREIIELIFSPGFSTAEQVTDVSGRGVGMDVVRRNVSDLGGAVTIRSRAGQGSVFTIKLPLTLAIIQALLVRVKDELYSIPLDAVIESQRIDARDVRTVHGGEVITLRGQVVPLIRVGEFFQLGAERDPDKVMIVIVGLAGRQVGLVVDSFQGEQEIVIKPLSDVIGRIAGISGATILGNGSISLIIDVHSLVAGAYSSARAARAEFAGV
ncbi:MAG: chemotaxis protein CheA [Candidatus Velthaea sp.]